MAAIKHPSSLPLCPQVLWILKQLQQAGYEAHIVGGAVRDLLLKAENPQDSLIQHKKTDYDVTTNATPEQIMSVFPEALYENDFGTVLLPESYLYAQLGWSEERIEAALSAEEAKTVTQQRFSLAAAAKVHASLQGDGTDMKEALSLKRTEAVFEITTYRSQEVYTDYRRPESLSWGQSLTEDLSRRDFTLNALALTIDSQVLESLPIEASLTALHSGETKTAPLTLEPQHWQLIDEYNGLEDLQAKLLRTVGKPLERFQEDALRMLRAIRFSVELNVEIDPDTFDAIAQLHHLLAHISAERIRDEFMKILKSPFAAEGVELLDETKLLQFIIPELLEGKGVEQGGHHDTDVWTHAIDSLRHCPSPDPIVRLATLLHDIGKPATYQLREGQITFYNHELVGARMAKDIARRLRLSKAETERVFLLVRHHMFYYQPHNTDAAIRRFMRKVGLAQLDDILDLREADRLGSGARRTSWRLEEMKARMLEQLNQPLDVTDLAVNGHDLMEELGLKPGPVLGELLQELLELVLEAPKLNTRESLLAKAQEVHRKRHAVD